MSSLEARPFEGRQSKLVSEQQWDSHCAFLFVELEQASWQPHRCKWMKDDAIFRNHKPG